MTGISHSELEDLQRCEKRWEYRYVRGFSKRVKGVKLERGDWVHALLASYWRALRDGKDVQEAIRTEHQRIRAEWWDTLFEEQQDLLGRDLPDTALGIALRYAARYEGFDRVNWRKILAVEAKAQSQFDWLSMPFTWKADALALDRQGWVWVIEHKVVTEIPNEDNRAVDTQGPRYTLAVRQLLQDKGVKVRGVGVLYDYLRDRVPAVPQENKDGSLSKRWIDTDYSTYLAAITERGLDQSDYADILERLQREGKPYFERWQVPRGQARLEQTARDMTALVDRLRYITGKQYAIRSLDRHRCPWDCEFFPLCLVELDGGDITPLVKEQYEVREVSRNGDSEPDIGTGQS